jgi:hypothetical protein
MIVRLIASMVITTIPVKSAVAQTNKRGALLVWFSFLEQVADRMPTKRLEYQLSANKKKQVFKWYKSDVKLFPKIYPVVTKDYFLSTWRTFYPHLKVRKWMRFSKCATCINLRANRDAPPGKATKKERDEAGEELNVHYQNVKEERRYSLQKQADAELHPDESMYISLDGTDQLGYGYPHFFMNGKEEKERLKAKIMVGCVPGVGVFCFDHLDNIAGDPNLVVECLMRILKAVEKKRGKLARTLYLQFDNCPRENKNTYIVGFCAWLVQRRVFDVIEMSFLPVGHTHNECDQVASRISLACRHADIFTRSDLADVIKQCYTPVPIVAHIDEVADFKSLVNPDHKQDFSGIVVCPFFFIGSFLDFIIRYSCAAAHLHRARGVSQPLHYKFQRINGVARVRPKVNVQQQAWSREWNIWRHEPIGRKCSFDLADMARGHCAFRVVTPEAVKKMTLALETCRSRMTELDYQSCMSDLRMLANPPKRAFTWPDGGVFACESLPDAPVSDVKRGDPVRHTAQLVHLREHPRIWSSAPRMAAEREDAKATTVPVTVGDFVAIGMNYGGDGHTIPLHEQRAFWVGQVTGIYHSTNRIQIHWYHTAARSRWINGKYKVWNVGNKTAMIPMDSIWAVWSRLTEARKIPTR